MSDENEIRRKTTETLDKREKEVERKKYLSLRSACNTLAVVMIIVSVLIVAVTIRKGSEAAKDAYDEAKKEAAEEAYNRFYETAFMSAERNYHVANTVSIDVTAVREEANLEVLKVSDVEYVIESRDENENNIEVWMEFYGEGVYTVDMKASEFIIDSDRQYVLVRVPRPELTNCRITTANELFWENGIFNKSYSVGIDLAEEMRNAGYTKLNEYMKSNSKFAVAAKKSATTLISDLVKGLNVELPNLVVEVEFVE